MRPEPQTADLLVRPGGTEDSAPLADLFLRAREAAWPAMPRPVRDAASVHAWFRGWYDGPVDGTPSREVWVAERAAAPVGYALLEDAWLHSLYVEPEVTGHGIGTVLLDVAKAVRPDGLGLWVFVSNERARRFYARHGFAEVRRTDGSDNEEGEPDIEMRWPGPASTPAE